MLPPRPAGKWTVQQAADLSVAAPTITSSLDGRYMSALKPERVVAAKVYAKLGVNQPTAIPGIDKAQLIDDVRKVRSEEREERDQREREERDRRERDGWEREGAGCAWGTGKGVRHGTGYARPG